MTDARSLHQLAARREAEASLFKDLNTHQATYEAVRGSALEHESHGGGGQVAPLQEKLRDGYQRAYTHAVEEARLASDALSHIKSILRRRDRRLRSSDDGESSELGAGVGGDIWSHDAEHVLSVGSEVAALVDEHSIPPLWIQCVVKGYRPGPRPKYEVLDLDPGDSSSSSDPSSDPAPARQKRYWLDGRKILPLPSLTEVPLTARREFAKGERVIAVFPTSGITTLYPAEVIQGPKKRKNHTYLLKFDDDEDVHRSVSAQYVAPLIELPEES